MRNNGEQAQASAQADKDLSIKANDGRALAKEARRQQYEKEKKIKENASVAGSGLHACKEGLLDELRVKVKQGWCPTKTMDRHGLTALQWAAGGTLPLAHYSSAFLSTVSF